MYTTGTGTAGGSAATALATTGVNSLSMLLVAVTLISFGAVLLKWVPARRQA